MTDRAEATGFSATWSLDSSMKALTCQVEPLDQTHPSDLELAQCQAEVGTLLRVIAELNEKMTALQTPRCLDNETSQGQVLAVDASAVSPSVQQDIHASTTSSKSSATEKKDSVELWTQLQSVLDALESSIIKGRDWITSYISSDAEDPTQHLTAATQIWVQVTQILNEIEREFGISYPSQLPTEERQKYQQDVLALHKQNCNLRATLKCREEELGRSEVILSSLEDEKNKLKIKILDFHSRLPHGGSISPPTSPSSSSSEAWSSCWATPPYSGSPLLSKRSPSTFPASPTEGSSPSSCSRGSPSSPMLETEVGRLQRYIERLKARNERLSASLERRKGESEQMSMTLNKYEADHSALQMALKYSEGCEEAYSQLLSLYEARKQPMLESRETAEAGSEEQLVISEHQPASPETGELLLSTCPTQGAKVAFEENRGAPFILQKREKEIREKILKLNQDRAAVCIPEQKAAGEGKLSPDTGTLAGCQNKTKPHNTTKERASLLHDLVTVREEMSELRGMIRLMERERRYLERQLAAQGAQDVAALLIADCLREELENRQTEERKLDGKEAKVHSGANVPGPKNRALVREIHAALQCEKVLKRRVAALRESLDAALAESTMRKRHCEEDMAQVSFTHSNVVGTYRSARKKHREQLWRLERQAAAMSEQHAAQIAGLNATLEALECKREETVL